MEEFIVLCFYDLKALVFMTLSHKFPVPNHKSEWIYENITVFMNGERVFMRNKSSQVKVYKQHLSKCVGGIDRSYSVLQDKFAIALQNNPEVKEFRLNIGVGKLPHFDDLISDCP